MGHILKGQVRYTLAVEDVIQQGEIPTDLQGLPRLPLSFTSGTTASFNENIDDDSLVYTAVAEKPNSGGSLGITYGLSGSDNTLFQLNTNSGALTINDSPDFENKSSYSLLVSASHTGFLPTTQSLALNVVNLDDLGVIFPNNVSFTSGEYVRTGQEFGSTVTTTDQDFAGAVTFTLQDQNGSPSDAGGRVAIYTPGSLESNQFKIRTGNTPMSFDLDGNSVDFTVKAVDQGGNASYKTYTAIISNRNLINNSSYVTMRGYQSQIITDLHPAAQPYQYANTAHDKGTIYKTSTSGGTGESGGNIKNMVVTLNAGTNTRVKYDLTNLTATNVNIVDKRIMRASEVGVTQNWNNLGTIKFLSESTSLPSEPAFIYTAVSRYTANGSITASVDDIEFANAAGANSDYSGLVGYNVPNTPTLAAYRPLDYSGNVFYRFANTTNNTSGAFEDYDNTSSSSRRIKLKSGSSVSAGTTYQLDILAMPTVAASVTSSDFENFSTRDPDDIYHTVWVGAGTSPNGHSNTVNTTNNTVKIEQTPINDHYVFNCTASGSQAGPHLVFQSSSDTDALSRNLSGSTSHPVINLYVGDTMTLNVPTSGSPFKIKTEAGGSPSEYIATGSTYPASGVIGFAPNSPRTYYYYNQNDYRATGLVHVMSKNDEIILRTGDKVGVAPQYTNQGMPLGDFANNHSIGMGSEREFYIRNWYEMEGDDEDYAGIVSFHTTKSGAEDTNSNQTDIVNITGTATGSSGAGLKIAPVTEFSTNLIVSDNPDLTTAFSPLNAGMNATDGGSSAAPGSNGSNGNYSVTQKSYGTLSVSPNSDGKYHIYVYGKNVPGSNNDYFASDNAIAYIQIVNALGTVVDQIDPISTNWETMRWQNSQTAVAFHKFVMSPTALASSFADTGSANNRVTTDYFESGSTRSLGTTTQQRGWNIRSAPAGSLGTGPDYGIVNPQSSAMALGNSNLAQVQGNNYLYAEQTSSSWADANTGIYPGTHKYMRSANAYSFPAGGSILIAYYNAVSTNNFSGSNSNSLDVNDQIGIALYPS